MPNEVGSLDSSLNVIDRLVTGFLSQEYFSFFVGAKDQLANLAVFNAFELNSDVFLGEVDQKEVTENLEKKKNVANISLLDHLHVCSEAIDSLRSWPVMQGHVVEKHLLDVLAKLLSEQINTDFAFKLLAITKHIDAVNSLNNFFKLLKKLNENELQDADLKQLLNKVDDNKGLVIPAENLVKEITSLSQDVYTYVKNKNLPTADDDGDDAKKIKKKIFLQEIFKALEPLQHINQAAALSFENIDNTKINELLENYQSRENFLAEIDTLFSEIKGCIEDKAWNSKAKNMFGSPHGIRELRKIFNNNDLDPLEKLFTARKQLAKKFKRSDSRDTTTSDFYDYLSRKLDALYEKVGSDYEESRKAVARGLPTFYWKNENYLELTKRVTEIRNEVQATVDELKDPSLARKLVGSWNQEGSKHLTLITYNVQQLIGSPDQEERSEAIIDYLRNQNTDIIILQEAFQPAFLSALEKSSLARDYHIIRPKTTIGAINSGVCTLLKKEKFGTSENLDVIQSDFSFATDVDALVPKGITQIKVFNRVNTVGNDEKIPICNILGVHTQAQYEKSPFQIIATLVQLAQLGRHIAENTSSTEPTLLAGDLNVILQRLADNKNNIEFTVAKYLLYPLLYHPTVGNSYDRESNLLLKTYNPKEPPANLDFVLSRHCKTKGEAEVLTNTRYTRKAKGESNHSDHYPVKTELEFKTPEQIKIALDEEKSCVIEQQKFALAELLRTAYAAATSTTLGRWQKEKGIKIHIAACNLIAQYDNLSDQEKGVLGTGRKFRDFCLKYNPLGCTPDKPATEPNYFFELRSQKVPPYALGELMEISIFTGVTYSSEVAETLGKRENEFFISLLKTFKTLEEHIKFKEWNDKGQGFFSKKTPDGIIKLRGLLRDFSNKSRDWVPTPIEKLNMIKRFMEIHQLTEHKKSSKSWFRENAVRQLYGKVHELFSVVYTELNTEQRHIFALVQDRNKSVAKGLSNLSSVNAFIFDETPSLPDGFYDKFGESLQHITDSIRERSIYNGL